MTETDTSTLWAVASGSTYGSSQADSSKDGIYESTDAGKSWDKSTLATSLISPHQRLRTSGFPVTPASIIARTPAIVGHR